MKPHEHTILQVCCKVVIKEHARDLEGTGGTPAKHPGLVFNSVESECTVFNTYGCSRCNSSCTQNGACNFMLGHPPSSETFKTEKQNIQD